jgi:hypothetical protein
MNRLSLPPAVIALLERGPDFAERIAADPNCPRAAPVSTTGRPVPGPDVGTGRSIDLPLYDDETVLAERLARGQCDEMVVRTIR